MKQANPNLRCLMLCVVGRQVPLSFGKDLHRWLLFPAGRVTIAARDDADCRWHFLDAKHGTSAREVSLVSTSIRLHACYYEIRCSPCRA